MNIGSMAWHILNGIVFVAWVVCIVSWVRHGCPVPRWVHIFAGSLLLAGVVCAIVLGSLGILSFKATASCLLIPPAVVYGGWLWLFGPNAARDENVR